jgi:hypothetical protein
MTGADEAAPRLQEAGEAALWSGRALRTAGLRFVVAAAYLLAMARLGTSGAAHFLLAAIWVSAALVRPVTRGWLIDALPFALFAAAYDALGLLKPFVATSGVHTFWPYWFDKAVFGIGSLSGRVSLNELFAVHHWLAVDIVTGAAYFMFLHAVLLLAVFMAVADRTPAGRRRLRAVGWTFLGVNVAAFLMYLAYPEAPPWYVATHGFGPVDAHAAASPAALARLDALTGIPYFRGLYAQASDVFGAMPSMHCAYPMLLLLYALELRRPVLAGGLVLFQLVTCFSAVYLQHHYVADVLAGTLFALGGYVIERAVSGRGMEAVPAGGGGR